MRRLQQELSQEREKYNQMLLKYQDLQQQAVEDQQVKQKMSMEIDCKATEIEHLQSKLNETASLSSADNDPEDTQVRHTHTLTQAQTFTLFSARTQLFLLSLTQDSVFEGVLSVPNKQNRRRGQNWKRQYVIVSSRKIIFYNTENDKNKTTDPVLILDLRYVFTPQLSLRRILPYKPFALQQSLSCAQRYPRRRHTRRCQRDSAHLSAAVRRRGRLPSSR